MPIKFLLNDTQNCCLLDGVEKIGENDSLSMRIPFYWEAEPVAGYGELVWKCGWGEFGLRVVEFLGHEVLDQ